MSSISAWEHFTSKMMVPPGLNSEDVAGKENHQLVAPR